MIHSFQSINRASKYFKWYLQLIEHARKSKASGYTEKHHILPRSCGGDDSSANVVALSARQHFVAHLMLVRFMTNEAKAKMFYAVTAMNMSSIGTLPRYFNSLQYGYLKEQLQHIRSDSMKNLWSDTEWRSKRLLNYRSPWKNPKSHRKSIKTRTLRGTNIWITNNPMHNPKSVKKKTAKCSGKLHYTFGEWVYSYSIDAGKTWTEVDRALTTNEMLKKHAWSRATLNYILSGKIPKRGPMAGLMIKRTRNENS